MTSQTDWSFLDDRGHRVTLDRRPRRIVAYIQAAAALWDHGISPVGLFGSPHDGEHPDRTKAGDLPLEQLRYLGSGNALRPDDVLDTRPELLVAVTYDGNFMYGMERERAEELEAQVPTVLLGTGPGRRLSSVRERFTELAQALGPVAAPEAAGVPDSQQESELQRAQSRLAATAAQAAHVRVLALSPAGPDRVHLARPGAWPDLSALTEHGVHMVEPPAGGANWSTTDWQEAAELGPDVVLADARGNATPEAELRGSEHWRKLVSHAPVVPWNPELPCTARAHARFFDLLRTTLDGTLHSQNPLHSQQPKPPS